jgi:hypothetical protein
LSVSNHAYEFSEKGVGRERGIGGGHRVAAHEETLVVPAQKAMQEESAFSESQDDLSAANIAD